MEEKLTVSICDFKSKVPILHTVSIFKHFMKYFVWIDKNLNCFVNRKLARLSFLFLQLVIWDIDNLLGLSFPFAHFIVKIAAHVLLL